MFRLRIWLLRLINFPLFWDIILDIKQIYLYPNIGQKRKMIVNGTVLELS